MNKIMGKSMLMRGFLALLLTAGMLSAAQAAETVEYIHTDALGSPVAVTDANGVVIERTVYEPYGAVVGGQVKDGPGYTGHVSDSATGLSYMQQRYMDPEVGSFLSVDPVTAHGENARQFNRYRYGNGNPYGFTDPDGRQATTSSQMIFPMPVPSAGGITQRSEGSDGDSRPVGPNGQRPTTRPTTRPTGRDTARRGRDGQPVESSPSKGDLHAPGDAPDATVIVRGGQGDMPAPGTTFSGSQGSTIAEAGAGVPHGSIRPSTAGEIRAGGGKVEVAPENTSSGKLNGNHVNVTEGAKGGSFGPVQQNPVPKVDRIK